MTCAQGLLRLLWGGGARSWSATGLLADVGNENYSFVGNAKGYEAVKTFVSSYF